MTRDSQTIPCLFRLEGQEWFRTTPGGAESDTNTAKFFIPEFIENCTGNFKTISLKYGLNLVFIETYLGSINTKLSPYFKDIVLKFPVQFSMNSGIKNLALFALLSASSGSAKQSSF